MSNGLRINTEASLKGLDGSVYATAVAQLVDMGRIGVTGISQRAWMRVPTVSLNGVLQNAKTPRQAGFCWCGTAYFAPPLIARTTRRCGSRHSMSLARPSESGQETPLTGRVLP